MREQEKEMSLTHWILSGHKPVEPEVAEVRARICRMCPLNESEDLYESVKGIAARVIRTALRRKHEMKLATSYDSDLHVCAACGCDMKLKIHAPMDVIIPNGQRPDYFDKLDRFCWIRNEEAMK